MWGIICGVNQIIRRRNYTAKQRKCREEKQMANDMDNYEMCGKIRVA